jgi:outer membrane cobalamin receptor
MRFGTLAGTLFVLSAIYIPGQAYSMEGITEQSLDQLSQTQFFTADTDRIARQISGAPSAVSVVTADDIRTYGYRTLSDILDSMRGVFMSRDEFHSYIGGRGYGTPTYAGRITLLIDGYRAQNGFFGQSQFGNDALLDVALIERVEYIPGTGSSSYGDSAFLGVVNIITKKGREIDGTEAATEFGSHRLRGNRVTFGHQLENGLDLAVSASGMSSSGRALPADLVGDRSNVEVEANGRYFVKAAYQGWTFEGATVRRSMPVSTMSTDPREQASDEDAYYRLRWNGDLNPTVKSSIDFYQGNYRLNDITSDGSWFQFAGADWRGIDAKVVTTAFSGHTIVVGSEYRDDFRQFYQDSSPANYEATRRTISLYVYDDVALTDNLQLTIGARRDARQGAPATLSPRAALVYSSLTGTVIRFSAGEAHLQPSPYHESYILNPQPELLRTTEIVVEQSLGSRTRLLGSLYRYQMPNSANGGSFNAQGYKTVHYDTLASQGAEFELEHIWHNGIRLRTSYARQDTRFGDGSIPANIPRDIAKFNLAVPLPGDAFQAGLAARYLGRRLDKPPSTAYEPGVLVVDLTLSGRWNAWGASASVRNLGNASYNTITNTTIPQLSNSHAYPADRRNLWFQLEYRFR